MRKKSLRLQWPSPYETNGLVSASLRNTPSNPIRFTLPALTHWTITPAPQTAPHVFIQRVR